MKTFEVEILRSAKLDIFQAKKWYNLQKYDLGNEFVEEVEKAYDRVKLNPYQFPKTRKDIRKLTLERFPYCLYFVIEPNIIRIFAVFHNSRNPVIWEGRMQ